MEDKFSDIGCLNFATQEDAQKAKALFDEMQNKIGRLVEALEDWAYQYPNQHLLTEYSDLFSTKVS